MFAPFRAARCASRARFHLVAPIIAMLALLAVSCDHPESPAGDAANDFHGRYDPLQGKLAFQLAGANGGRTSLQLVATSLEFDPAMQQLHALVTIRNNGAEAVPGPDGVLVRGFAPETVRPVNARCDGDSLEDADCWFDYRGRHGSDGLLSPGEASEPCEWILFDPAAESFAFHARLRYEAGAARGEISGIVFEDHDADGRRDEGDAGVPDVTLRLVYGDSSTTTRTDAAGRYGFHLTEPGLYEIEAAPPEGRSLTTPSPLSVVLVRRSDGTLSSFGRADFGWVPSGGTSQIPVHGIVYEDLNWNAAHDAGEPGIAWVELKGEACDSRLESIQSDAFGRYAVGMPDCGGPWSVRAPSLDGYTRTSPKTVTFTTAPAASESLRADFGYVHTDPSSRFEIRGSIYRDDNGNGVRDYGEPGIAGVSVRASGAQCTNPTAAIAWTDERGRFELDGGDVHCPLPWNITHGPVPGTHDTSPGTVRIDFPPADGGDTYRFDFGIAADDPQPRQASYAIEGDVYLDLDRSGRRDPGEPGLAGAEVQLLGPCQTLRRATSDASGHYRFETGVVSSCAVTAVWQSLPEFDKHTTPNPVPVDPAIPPPSDLLQVDFGIRGRD